MIQEFSFSRISLGGPIFDLQKLEWLNGMYIRQLSAEDLTRRLQQQIAQPKARALDDIDVYAGDCTAVTGAFTHAGRVSPAGGVFL